MRDESLEELKGGTMQYIDISPPPSVYATLGGLNCTPRHAITEFADIIATQTTSRREATGPGFARE